QAKKEFQTVQRLDAKFADGYFNLGTVLVEEQQYAEAMWQLMKAIELKPDHVPAIGALSFIYDRQGDTDGAIALLERAISYKPSEPQLHEFLGGHQYRAKQYQAAINSFSKAMELNP